jgi:hypothetical protein
MHECVGFENILVSIWWETIGIFKQLIVLFFGFELFDFGLLLLSHVGKVDGLTMLHILELYFHLPGQYNDSYLIINLLNLSNKKINILYHFHQSLIFIPCWAISIFLSINALQYFIP